MPLTRREEEVANLIVEGLSNKLIADRLGISDYTAKFHVRNVCDKYATTSRVVVAAKHTMVVLLRTHAPKRELVEVGSHHDERDG